MKKQGIIGLVVGLTAGIAAAVAGGMATARVVKEIKNNPMEDVILSPDGNHTVTISRGVSDFAKGLTRVKIIAASKTVEDECKFSFLAGKGASNLAFEWIDNDHFELVVGKGKLKHYCDVDFNEDQIDIFYYWHKVDLTENGEETVEEIAEETVEETVEETAEVLEAVETPEN